MNYNWDIEKLEKQKKIIQNCIRITKGLTKEEIQFLKSSIKQIKELEDILFNRYQLNQPRKIHYMDSHKLLPIKTYQDFQSIPYYIKETILKATRLFKDLDDTYDNIPLPIFNVSNQDLVEMSYDFYSLLPDSSFLKDFIKYTDPKKHLLQFKNAQMKDIFGGQTYIFYYPKYIPYFLIYRRHDISDFLSLNHEISHAIMYQHDTYTVDKKNHYFLTELEGYFFDYLSIQYLKKFYSEEVINQLEYDRITAVLEDFATIFIDDTAIQLFENNRKITLHSIKNRFQKWNLPFSINSVLLKETLWEDVRYHSCCILSLLTSLDLEMIYEKDPEYAFYLFEKIRNNKTDHIFQNLEKNGISFMGERENYDPFQKKIQWINQLGEKRK